MKKLIFVLTLSLAVIGTAMAQNNITTPDGNTTATLGSVLSISPSAAGTAPANSVFDGYAVNGIKFTDARGDLLPSVPGYSDANGYWQANRNITVTAIWKVSQIIVTNITNVGVSGQNTGKITVDFVNCAADVTPTITPTATYDATTKTFSGLAADTYTIAAENVQSVIVVVKESGSVNPASITIGQPDPLVAGTINVADVNICSGTTGTVLASGNNALKGTLPYTYIWQKSTDNTSWSDITGTSQVVTAEQTATTVNGYALTTAEQTATTETVTYYRRQVTDHCDVVLQTAPVKVTVSPNPTFVATPADAICNNSADDRKTGVNNDNYRGSIQLSDINSAEATTITWTGTTSGRANYNGAVDSYQIVGLEAGIYSITIENDGAVSACAATVNNISVAHPAKLEAGTISASQFVCHGEDRSELKGTDAKYAQGDVTYKWSDNVTTQNNPAAAMTATTDYTLTYSDKCFTLTSNELTVTVNPELTYTVSTNPLECNAGTDGIINVVVTGGSEGTFVGVCKNSEPATDGTWVWAGRNATVSGLSADTFTITVEDSKGCVAHPSTTSAE